MAAVDELYILVISSGPFPYRPVVHQLLDVVDQTVERPLRVDLASAAQREAIQPLVVTEIAEHRLDGGEPSAIVTAALGAVDLAPHLAGGRFRGIRRLAPEERHLPAGGLVGISQTLFAQGALLAVLVRAAEPILIHVLVARLAPRPTTPTPAAQTGYCTRSSAAASSRHEVSTASLGGNLAIHDGFKVSRRDTPTLALSDESE